MTVTAATDQKPVFYILCGNAAYNRGDRGNLYSQITLIKKHFPNVQLVFDSAQYGRDQEWYDVLILKRSIIPNKQQRIWLKKADIVIVGGGALLADNSCRLLVPYWFLYIFYVKKLLGKPVMIWANGLILQTRAGKWLGRLALNMADYITVRDIGSLHTCQELKIERPTEQTADPAILLTAGDKSEGEAILKAEGIPTDRPIICLSPTFWHFYHDQKSWLPYPMGKRFFSPLNKKWEILERYLYAMSRLAQLLAQEHSATILLMPRYAAAEWDDVSFCKQIAEESGLNDKIHIMANDSYPPEQFFALWKCFSLNISVALHDAIFATVMDCPVLHLHYESKGKDFFDALDTPEQLMPWTTLFDHEGPERIAKRATRILSNWHITMPKRADNINHMKTLALRNVDVLKQLYAEISA